MNCEEVDFPGDPNTYLGDLRKALTIALRSADSNEDAAKLLASTLGFAASKLRQVYKEDDIKSKAQISREAKTAKLAEKERKAAEKVTAALVKTAKNKLAKPAMRKHLDPVQRLKRKAKK